MTSTDNTPVSTWKRVGLVLAGVVSVVSALASILVAVANYNDWSLNQSSQNLAVLITAAVACLFFGWLACFCFSRSQPKESPLEKPAFCQCCGSSAPTMKAGLNRHIGAVVLMFHKSYKGYFCRACVAKTFWEYTAVTLAFGWWGLFSFFITPVVLINNLIVYSRSFSLGHTPPLPTEDLR